MRTERTKPYAIMLRPTMKEKRADPDAEPMCIGVSHGTSQADAISTFYAECPRDKRHKLVYAVRMPDTLPIGSRKMKVMEFASER